jgi:hypothetical protein
MYAFSKPQEPADLVVLLACCLSCYCLQEYLFEHLASLLASALSQDGAERAATVRWAATARLLAAAGYIRQKAVSSSWQKGSRRNSTAVHRCGIAMLQDLNTCCFS